jgi:hypothetical protein
METNTESQMVGCLFLYLGILVGLQTGQLVENVASPYFSVHHHKSKCWLRFEPGTSEYKSAALLPMNC